jgi:hypothetical protein
MDRADDYVPLNLDEALLHLACTLEPEVLQAMYEGTEDDMYRYHFGLGMWMRNNWGLWSGSPLNEELTALGLTVADDMSGFLLVSFWRRLHGRPLRIRAQVRGYERYWEAYAEPPPLRCPDGSEVESKASTSWGSGSFLFPYRVTNFAFCEGDGWYKTKGASDRWRFIGEDVPDFLKESDT